MAISIYQVSVPAFTNMLKALSGVLAKAEANATERKIDPSVFLSARLAPDMLPLTRQVMLCSDHAKGASSRLAGKEVPRFEDTETTFAELQARLTKTIDHLASLDEKDFDGAETRTITMNIGQREMSFPGLAYLNNFAMPNFYFHVSMAYAILRHNGVPIGKRAFLGAE